MKKTTPTLLLFVLALGFLSGCKTGPEACYTIVTPSDSIRVGHMVTFSASCSNDAAQYFWDFGNGQSSTSSTTAQTTYDSAASYSVALVVANSGKSASISKTIVVKP